MKQLVSASLAFALVAACDLSSTPDTGADTSISGRFTYQGPPPLCERGEVLGRFLFLLYLNPIARPLDGGNATAFSARALAPDFVFDPEIDCDLSPTVEITRERAYTLEGFGPNRTLLEETDFRLIVVYDHDENLVARDPIRGQPNRGDIFGAAYTTVASRRFSTLSFGPTVTKPSQQLDDVDITVDAEVWSDIPAFRIRPGTQPLSSEAVVLDDTSVSAWESEVYALTQMQLEALPASTEPWRTVLDEEGLIFDNNPARGFWSRPADPRRELNGLLHPFYGVRPPAFRPEGIEWKTPFVVFQRVQSPAEVQTGVPDVYLVPITRPSEDGKRLFAPTVDMMLPPVALVDLDPERPICQIPFVAPGNYAEAYEGDASQTGAPPIECQELPTGDYTVTLHQGVAGGIRTSGAPSNVSDTGFRVDDDEYIGQRWTLPNDLPLNDQRGYYSVIDTDVGSAPDHEATDLGHGVSACTVAQEEGSGDLREVNLQPIQAALCCSKVQHLCGIPLCEAEDGMRAATSAGGGRPNCMPFLIPQGCCPQS